jgi:hypothetical protein
LPVSRLQPVVNLRCLAFAQAAKPAVTLITHNLRRIYHV